MKVELEHDGVELSAPSAASSIIKSPGKNIYIE